MKKISAADFSLLPPASSANGSGADVNLPIPEAEDGRPTGRARFRKPKLYQVLLLTGVLVLAFPLFAHLYERYQTGRVIADFSQLRIRDEETANELRRNVVAYQDEVAERGFLAAPQDPFTTDSAAKARELLPDQSVAEQKALSFADGLNLGPVQATLNLLPLNEQLPIYMGSSEKVLRRGLGLMPGSSLPYGGEGTNCVITGHRGTYDADLLRNVDRLKVGDSVLLDNPLERLAYRVRDIKVVEPDALDSIRLEPGADLLTLVTCHPYLINSHRLIITCARDLTYKDEFLPGSAAVRSLPPPASVSWLDALGSGHVHPYYWAVALLLLVLLVWPLLRWLLRRRTRKAIPLAWPYEAKDLLAGSEGRSQL